MPVAAISYESLATFLVQVRFPAAQEAEPLAAGRALALRITISLATLLAECTAQL